MRWRWGMEEMKSHKKIKRSEQSQKIILLCNVLSNSKAPCLIEGTYTKIIYLSAWYACFCVRTSFNFKKLFAQLPNRCRKKQFQLLEYIYALAQAHSIFNKTTGRLPNWLSVSSAVNWNRKFTRDASWILFQFSPSEILHTVNLGKTEPQTPELDALFKYELWRNFFTICLNVSKDVAKNRSSCGIRAKIPIFSSFRVFSWLFMTKKMSFPAKWYTNKNRSPAPEQSAARFGYKMTNTKCNTNRIDSQFWWF